MANLGNPGLINAGPTAGPLLMWVVISTETNQPVVPVMVHMYTPGAPGFNVFGGASNYGFVS